MIEAITFCYNHRYSHANMQASATIRVPYSPPYFVNVAAVSRATGYSEGHIRLLIRQEKLSATKFGRDWLILWDSRLRALVAESNEAEVSAK